MNSDARKAIDDGLETHLQELSYVGSEWNTPLIKESKENVEANQLREESREVFEKYKNIFLREVKHDPLAGGIIHTKPVCYRNFSETFHVPLNKLRENIQLSYYYGKSYAEPSFIGIVYGLEFYPYKFGGKEFMEKIQNSEAFENLKKINYNTESIQTINDIAIPKNILIGLEDPFWDEYSKLVDASLTIEMQIIRPDNQLTVLKDFYRKCNVEAKKLDNTLINILLK